MIEKKKIFLTILIALVILIGTPLIFPRTSHAPEEGSKEVDDVVLITLGTTTVRSIVARDEMSRAQGLSGTEKLDENTGLFFVFDTSDLWGIWMKDMKFPIDILWMNNDLKIVHIERAVGPETFPKIFFPTVPARYVLEIPSGTVDRANIRANEIVSISGNI